MSILSTREWATLIWGGIFIVYILCNKETRKGCWEIVVICFGKKLRWLWEIILIYVFIITMVFYHLSIWDNIYIKDIVIWFFFSGLIYCINAISDEADEKYIQTVLKDKFKLTLILEFFMSTFTFSIWIEFVIIPVITIITVMNIMSEKKEEYRNVHKLLDFALAVTGFWILCGTIKIGITEYKKLEVINTLVCFMIPIVYSILIIPLEYVLELYSKYESLFIRMSFKEEKDKKMIHKHWIDVFCACGFSVSRVLLFRRKYLNRMYIRMDDDEFKQIICEFKNECRR